MVDIYLPMEGQQVLTLSIPFSDIERLSLRPGFDSLHSPFVAFEEISLRRPMAPLSTMTVSLLMILLPKPTTIHLRVYSQILLLFLVYTFIGDYHIIDYKGMNDRISSSEQTLRASSFRRGVKARDGSVCVFTGYEICDATHLLPKSKGDAVSIRCHCSMSSSC